jgi:hypothetical protein
LLAPWSGETPLDVVEQAGQRDLMVWLLGKGVIRGKKHA